MLVEMGYEKNNAIYALKVTSNNVEHACSFLLSNPNPASRATMGFNMGRGGPSSGGSRPPQGNILQ